MTLFARIALLLMLACSSGFGLESIRDLQSEFIVEYHQTEEGLPDNFINHIAQTPDGYLWVATFNGLARYNGVEFVSFDSANTPGLVSSRTTRLIVDGAGRLWIKSENSRLSVFSNGTFRSLGAQDGFPDGRPVTAIELNSGGNIVTASGYHDTNFFEFNGRQFQQLSGSNLFVRMYGLMRDTSGIGWTINDSVEIPRLLNNDPANPVDTPVPDLPKGKGWRLHGSGDGGLWVLAGAFRKFKNGRWEHWADFPVDTDQFGGFTEDHLGNFWVGVSGGELWRLDTNRVVTRFKLPDARISELGRALFCDAENNLWVGTGGLGLLRLESRIVKSIDSKSGLSSDVTRSVTEDRDGNIWLATLNTVDCIKPGTREILRNQHPEIQLPWIVHGSTDGLWIGSYGEGLFHYNGGVQRRFNVGAPGRWPPMNLSFLKSRSGTTYLGTAGALFELQTNTLIQVDDAGPKREIRCIVEDRSGNIYFALNGQGMLQKSGPNWRMFTTRDGLPSDHLWALHFDQEQTLWIGTEGSLSRFKNGKFYNYTSSSGALPRFINCIIEDDVGSLWLASNRGIFSARLSDLNALAEGRASSVTVNRFDRSDGMGSSQCTGSACKARDGRLWFTTMNGVAVIDPSALPHNSRPPPIVVEETLIDDKAVSLANNALTIPPGAHRVEIRFAGLSFTTPDRVRFRYRLEGIDHNWVDTTRRSAFYSRLAPGNYRFEVIVANNDGIWNESGATLAIVAQPFLWQRSSVQVAAALALLGAAIALARYWSAVRFRRRVAELERRHALDRERGRISRDLHDSLGADLSQLALWTDLALEARERPSAMVEHTRNASSLVREVIQNVEEIVWTVNPRNDSLDHFVAYLCEFSERTVTRAGLRFRWEAPDQIPSVPLVSDIRHHLFLVTKETLNNIVKHAGASEVRVQISIQDDRLEIAIADNGRGFDQNRKSNRNGLKNVRERVASCRGELVVASATGSGTTIRILVPLREPVTL